MTGNWELRRGLSAIPAYIPGRKAPTEPGNLAANEFPLGPSPAVLAAIGSASSHVHRYPDPLADELREVLSDELEVERDQILIGNGSDELLYLLMSSLDQATSRIAIADPPYQLHRLVPRIFGIETVSVPLVDWTHDLSGFSRVDANAAMICNPHNPTGTSVSRKQIASCAAAIPATPFVVDEAYIEFADDPESLSCVPLTGDGDVSVMRSLSKSLAIAGLRVGYLVGSTELIALLRKIRPPFSVNSLAQAAAVAALRDREYRDFTRTHVQAMRLKLVELLNAFGYESIPSQANFVLVKIPDEERFRARLFESGVSVRPGSHLGVEGTVRVTVPSEEGLVLLERALSAFALDPSVAGPSSN
jgi:histidinol-phosphate aminotransferase